MVNTLVVGSMAGEPRLPDDSARVGEFGRRSGDVASSVAPRVAILTNELPSYRQGFYNRLLARQDIVTTGCCQTALPGTNVQPIHARCPDRVRLVKAVTTTLLRRNVVPRTMGHSYRASALTDRMRLLWTRMFDPDAEVSAAAVRSLLHDQPARSAIRQHVQHVARTLFNVDVMVERFVTVVRGVLAAQSPARSSLR